MKRYLMLPISTTDDGKKCDGCCWLDGLMDDRCRLWNLPVRRQERHAACTSHETPVATEPA